MCDPVSLAVAAAAVGTASSLAQARAQEEAADENEKQATTAAIQQYKNVEQRQLQEREATAASIRNVVRESQQARGALQAGAAGGGVAGKTIEALYADFERQQTENTATKMQQLRFAELDLASQRLGIQAQQQDRFNSVPHPSPLGVGLQIASTVVGAAQSAQGPRKT